MRDGDCEQCKQQQERIQELKSYLAQARQEIETLKSPLQNFTHQQLAEELIRVHQEHDTMKAALKQYGRHQAQFKQREVDLAQTRQERDDWKDAFREQEKLTHSMRRERNEFADELSIIQKERDTLKAALRKYGRHLNNENECEVYFKQFRGEKVACTCGLTAALGE